MSQDTLYISPEYNPHSLQRDWGFVVSAAQRDVFDVMSENLTTIRSALYLSVVKRTTPDGTVSPKLQNNPAKVTTDGFSENGEALYHEVGLDILALALLADVPIHRPLHLTQNSLIGHWRWLRDVWRLASSLPRIPEATHTPNAMTEALQSGKNNLAIARLRDLFKKVQQDPKDPGLYNSFLTSLSLFCPFIATELLWRQGRIAGDPPGRSGSKQMPRSQAKEGMIE
jgi:hypothetical protein